MSGTASEPSPEEVEARDSARERRVGNEAHEAHEAPKFPGQAALEAKITALEQDRDLLEDEVRRLHRVKTMVDLLAATAHDMSSALTGIVWASEALRARIAAYDPDLGAGVADFVSAANYARKLARRLISIGSHRESDFTTISFQATVMDALELLDALQPPTVTLQTRLDSPAALGWGNADQIQQVLINLVNNAFDTMRVEGGKLSVELSVCAAPPDADGEFVGLVVSDSGPGMTPEILARAREPFFTTKTAHDGNGLGLVIAQTIVERHGGTLEIKSDFHAGTRVEVRLPTL